MSIVILPSRWRNDAEPTPAGLLASTMVSVAVASIAEPNRLQRGRAYARGNVVLRIEVTPGRLQALVAGSRPDPYEVVVKVPTVAPPRLSSGTVERGDITALAPEGRQLAAACSCPDADNPCKHIVATLLVWADELRTRPELLVEWRCSPDAPPARATVGSRRAPAPPAPLPPAQPEADPFATPEWAEFFGSSAADELPPLPELPTTPIVMGAALVGRVDIDPMITDLLGELHRT